MGKLNNLVGEKFGRLTVRYKNSRRSEHGKLVTMWHCNCDCGKECDVLSSYLKTSECPSCGCYEIPYRYKGKEDWCNRRFGRLTTLGVDLERMQQQKDNNKIVSKNGGKIQTRLYIKCLCDCGNITSVRSENLKDGSVISCGCYQLEVLKEIPKKYSKKYNEIVYQDKEITRLKSSNSNYEIIIDTEDYEKIKKYCWNTGSAKVPKIYAPLPKEEREIFGTQNIALARLIMENPKNKIVDHRNHNTLDNRKANLRITDNFGNNQNIIRRKDGQSNVPGVTKERNKWHVQLQYNLHRMDLGRYDSYEEAVGIRLKAEKAFFDEYSYTNSMYKEFLMKDYELIKIDLPENLEDRNKLINYVNTFFNDVDIICGRYIFDCKSTVSVMSIDRTRDVYVRLITDDVNEQKRFKKCMEEFQ